MLQYRFIVLRSCRLYEKGDVQIQQLHLNMVIVARLHAKIIAQKLYEYVQVCTRMFQEFLFTTDEDAEHRWIGR